MNDKNNEVIETYLDDEYAGLDDKETIARLKRHVLRLQDSKNNYYATKLASTKSFVSGHGHIPEHGTSASHCKEQLVQICELDNRPRLNTSSYVNVVLEKEEEEIAIIGLGVNIADGSVYPASTNLMDNTVDAIATLWNCPPHVSPQGEKIKHFAGAGTCGSTEACLLALLAHKQRWRNWYQERNGLTEDEVKGVIPNMIIATHYQACWEKAFRYFDIKPKFLYPVFNKFKVDAEDMRDLIDDKTMMVVGIMGNHYSGTYDPIWDMEKVIGEVNEEKGFQLGLHVDAASGGFVAPFQDDLPAWDFRLKNVLSVSASGHKFGESSCGTGWVIFRHRDNLSEHIEVEVTYLGGISHSMTLNFSRPATGIYVQAYKFLRLGMQGYRQKVENQLHVTSVFRERMRKIKWITGEPFFQISDADEEPGLPVCALRVNPALDVEFDNFSIQHAVGEFHWYIGAYHLSFEDFGNGGAIAPFCKDEPVEASMFRVVFKSNLTLAMAEDLVERIEDLCDHYKEDATNKKGDDAVVPKTTSIREAMAKKANIRRDSKPHSNDHSAC